MKNRDFNIPFSEKGIIQLFKICREIDILSGTQADFLSLIQSPPTNNEELELDELLNAAGGLSLPPLPDQE